MRIYFLVPVIVVLCACNGSSSEDSEGPSSNVSPGGIWVGTLQSAITGQTEEGIALISESGEMRVSITSGEESVGSIAVTEDSFTAELTSFAPFGRVFLQNNESVVSGTASGSFLERASMTGTATIAGSTASTFTFEYDETYDSGSSLDRIAGLYAAIDGTTQFLIANNGIASGADANGCGYEGAAELIDQNYNLYRLRFEVTSCGEINDNYSGLVTLVEFGENQGDALYYSVSSNRQAISGWFERL